MSNIVKVNNIDEAAIILNNHYGVYVEIGFNEKTYYAFISPIGALTVRLSDSLTVRISLRLNINDSGVTTEDLLLLINELESS